MGFMLIRYGSRHLHIESDDGHLFEFAVVPCTCGLTLEVGQVHWCLGRQPSDSFSVLEHASRFASVCAEDFGLL